jgi:type IV secretory pathway TrbD component
MGGVELGRLVEEMQALQTTKGWWVDVLIRARRFRDYVGHLATVVVMPVLTVDKNQWHQACFGVEMWDLWHTFKEQMEKSAHCSLIVPYRRPSFMELTLRSFLPGNVTLIWFDGNDTRN